MVFLTIEELSKAQAEAEGFQNGPQPALNHANLSTQDSLGNTQSPSTSPAPYYPSQETPNLSLTTSDMSSALANNFVLIDNAVSLVPVISASLQVPMATGPETLTIASPALETYAVSLYLESSGTGAAGATLTATLSWASPLTSHTIALVLPLDSPQILMETYPLLVAAATPITLTTAYSAGAAGDVYSISARIVQMPQGS